MSGIDVARQVVMSTAQAVQRLIRKPPARRVQWEECRCHQDGLMDSCCIYLKAFPCFVEETLKFASISP